MLARTRKKIKEFKSHENYRNFLLGKDFKQIIEPEITNLSDSDESLAIEESNWTPTSVVQNLQLNQ